MGSVSRAGATLDQQTRVPAGSNIDLVPLLYEPAQFEAKPTGGSSSSASPSGAPSILDALHSLTQQCHVFKKSAEQLGQLLLPAALALAIVRV